MAKRKIRRRKKYPFIEKPYGNKLFRLHLNKNKFLDLEAGKEAIQCRYSGTAIGIIKIIPLAANTIIIQPIAYSEKDRI
jgi:hypothetical protein